MNKFNIKEKISSIFSFKEEKNYNFTLSADSVETSQTPIDTDELLDTKYKNIFTSLDVNLEYLKVKYNSLINSDVIIREFTLNARNKTFNAFIIYIDGMTDSQMINHSILRPLMLKNFSNSFNGEQTHVISEAVTNNISVKKIKKFSLVDYIYNSLVPQNSIEKISDFKSALSGINMGNCILFVDTINIAFNLDVKGFKQRSISSPQNETIVRGSQEGFVEIIRTNTSILRRLVNNENLVIENLNVGKISKTACAVCYMKNIANDDLVAEVKYRINNLNIDYLISSGQLEHLIVDNQNISLPQLIATERPDRVANYLLEGRVAIIINGNPYVLVTPRNILRFLIYF